MAVGRRTRGREVALQLLYQIDLMPAFSPDDEDRFLRDYEEDEEVRAFASGLADGVRAHRADLDARIERLAHNWHLKRMPVIDRNIMRLGGYELLHTDTPPNAVINEAVELAKRFSSKDAGGFVNGILDRLKRERGGEPTGTKTAGTGDGAAQPVQPEQAAQAAQPGPGPAAEPASDPAAGPVAEAALPGPAPEAKPEPAAQAAAESAESAEGAAGAADDKEEA